MQTVIRAITTGNPPLRGTQRAAAAFMERVTSIPEQIRKRIPAIYERSGIEYRYSCVDDWVRDVEDFDFFPQNDSLQPAPTTAHRNQKYREAVLPLATDVAGRALQEANVDPSSVTHVIAVSCTGFFAPGLDIELVKRLGLPADTRRTFIGFMGCYAAFNALRVADGFCRSHPNATVLVVCVELCTLHFQVNGSLESAIVNAIFSDGAAAAVLQGVPEEEAHGALVYVEGRPLLDEDSMGDMTWELGDTGFMMGLTSRVPTVLARQLPAYIDGLLSSHGLDRSDVGFWGIHPGGRAIVEKAQEVLGLNDDQVHDSLEVLRLHGNMSSPTILFVLKRLLEKRPIPEIAVAIAFGPGLTIEGALFKVL
jgi:predicted naringenin-chalcone synthase